MAHVEGQSRYQTTLFPETLDDVMGEDNPVRVIDYFVDKLDLAELGFSKVVAEETGRPPYAPGDLLKLYIYGYLNQVRSSRRLEREARRNFEVMWLVNRLTPAFKTIADFRKDHAVAIVGVSRAFIRFWREQDARARQERPQERSDVPPADMAAAIAALQARRAKLQQEARTLAREGLNQRVTSEPEAKLMRTAHGHQVAYNAQIAVDAQHHLIAAFDLTNEGNDHQQLHPMAQQGKAAVGADQVTVVADTGYSNGEQGAHCEPDKIPAIGRRPETANPEGKQYFTRDRFDYDAASDSWRCPAGATLTCHMVSNAQQQKRYATDACGACALKPQCTDAARRYIYRSC